ncbi:hypothetical protein ACFQQB_44580 [Nonomuraea rubra]|uniref:hypothetical protein n=1 Tax=Nonomuraea rubra TaxID=46180 RepID=UPI003607699D
MRLAERREIDTGQAGDNASLDFISCPWLVSYYLSRRPDAVPPEDLTIGGHRLFEINFLGAVGEVDLPYYSEDGEGDAEGLGLERYRGYWEGLEILPPSLEEEMEMFLTLLGRITGRFLDRDWASSQGLLCRVP